MLALHWKCLVQGSPWILQIPWMMTWFSKSLTRAQLWGQMRSNIQIILRVGVIGGADKGSALCHSALREHLGSVLACEDSWFTESIVSQSPGFTDSKRRGWTLPIHGLFRWHCQRHFHCFFLFFLRTLFCLFFWHTTQLAGYQFTKQELNLNHGSESAESYPLDHQGAPLFCPLFFF